MTAWHCPDCSYTYDEAKGDAHEGYAPGTPFAALPDGFVCPDCCVRDKADFVADAATSAAPDAASGGA